MIKASSGVRTRRAAGRLAAVAFVAIVACVGSGTAAYAGSQSYGQSNASYSWHADNVRKCYANGHSITFTTGTNFASGGEQLRAWDDSHSTILGTSALMTSVGSNYLVASGPSGTNNCGSGSNGFYLDYRKGSTGSDSSFSGTLYY